MPESQAAASSDTPKSRVAVLRHPLVVGAAVAVISAFFASLLIPSITQVTQDRPKELELKRGIIERISGASATAWQKGIALTRDDLLAAGGQPHQPRSSVYRQVLTDWYLEASAVDGEITTYFGHGDTWKKWWTLRESTKRFLELTNNDLAFDTRRRNANYLCENLGAYVTERKRLLELHAYCKVLSPKSAPKKVRRLAYKQAFANAAFGLSLDLEAMRNRVTFDLVETPAAGFRHSPWSLG